MEVSLARNADVQRILTTGTIKTDRAFDLCFLVTQATSFKLQGSADDGNSYNDIEGSSTLVGATGTLTASVAYAISLTRCRFDHVKAIFAGTNPTCIAVRQSARQSPKADHDNAIQVTIIDPIAGTA